MLILILFVASSINFGVSKLNTEYFIHLSPDLSVNFNQIKIFFYYAKKLDDNFCALGPRFLNTKKKGHIQIDEKLKIGKINSIHGSYMFMKKKRSIKDCDWRKSWQNIDYKYDSTCVIKKQHRS